MPSKTLAMHRLFAAIPVLPEPGLLNYLSEARAYFRQEKIRWVKPEHLHITLKFFGETSKQLIPEIETQYRTVIPEHCTFHCRLEGVGIFGSRYDPRVIWAAMGDDTPLRTLAEEVLEASAIAGFPRERLPFVPHLTLGRIHHIKDKKRLNDWILSHQQLCFQLVPVHEVVLFESILKSTGAQYSIMARFALSSQNQ